MERVTNDLAPSMKYALIALPEHPTMAFDYSIPKDLEETLFTGSRVEVFFRKKRKVGYVIKIKERTEFATVLPISAHLQEGSVSSSLLSLAEWMALYYCAPLSKVLFTMIPSSILNPPEERTQLALVLARAQKETLEEIAKLRACFPKRALVLEKTLQKTPLPLQEVARFRSQVATLCKQKWLKKTAIPRASELLLQEEFFPSKKKSLTLEQKNAYLTITQALEERRFRSFLLHGITGSGKTEVYLQLTEKARLLGKDALILVPEVALTSQLIEKFRSRFQEPIGIIHHQRSPKEKLSDWKKMERGELHIVLGARSAVFAPLKNLGIIIIDEEHDSSYKQSEEMPTYNARDVAIKRGSLLSLPVVLGSATPSLETYYKAKSGKYTLLSMKERATSSPLAPITMISMEKEYEKAGGFTHFSAPLIEGIKKRAEKGEQTLLFFNRRGYRTSRVCLKCNKPLRCSSCDISLTFHKKENLMRCHLCHFQTKPPRNCPYCNALDLVTYKGFGTEHIERSLKALLPTIRTLRMDRDTTQKKGSHEELFRAFRSGKADVLIGTQMIAKGFHFPAVTLVGILHPERTLFLPDFRAPETVFQLVTQVAGRAGRADLKGEVLIQTHLPEDPTLLLAQKQDYTPFYEEAIEGRKLFLYPPFSRMIKVLISSPKQNETRLWAERFHQKLGEKLQKEHIYPITEPAHEKVCGRFRLHILIRTGQINKTSLLVKALLTEIKMPRSLRILVDVDCLSTL
ncbi:MAG: primosomal protein N' [Chlamydiota bacterium]